MVEVVIFNTGEVLFLDVLFSGLGEEEELDTVFFEACKCSVLAFPEGQKQ